METISNVAETVKKTIWGETATTKGNETAGTEPISGQQGKGTVEEPYDQGNAENAATTSTKTAAAEPSITTEPTPSAKTETMSSIPPNTDNAATGGSPNPLSSTDKTGITESMEQSAKPTAPVASESQHPGVPPTSGGITEQKQQGADRPAEAPAAEKKEEAEDFMKTRDPNDHSGEPMKMHGSADTKIPETQEERRDSKIGLPGGQEHGKAPKGTGEEWVKTSGMAADGGDFDATKPGAGREAERLLEEKGIHKTPGNTGPPEDLGSPSSPKDKDGKDKVRLSEKIKTKLHIGHKDK